MSLERARQDFVKTIDDIQYFVTLLPYGSDTTLANIRLMDLDELLMEAKFALDHLISAGRPTLSSYPTVAIQKGGSSLLTLLGLRKPTIPLKRRSI